MFSRELLTQLYWTDQLSIMDIAQKIGRSKSSIHRDLIFYGIKRRSYSESYLVRDSNRKCWHNEINLEMKPSLAYVLGACLGDGYVVRKKTERGKCITILGVTNRKFAEEFASNVRELGLNCSVREIQIKRDAKHKKNIFRATFYCAQFYYWYKSLTFKKIENLLDTTENIRAFIKGFYEAEGCYYRRSSDVARLTISNSNRQLLCLIRKLLKKIGYNFHLNGPIIFKNPKWKPAYRLALAIKEDVNRFLIEINPCIKN